MNTQKARKTEHDGINPMAAAITGAVVGAGMAVAGAMVMKDEKKRAKVMDMLNTAKDQASEHMDMLQDTIHDKKDKVKAAALDEKKMVRKEVTKAKKTAETKAK